ncbi:MAG: isopenicillin N synthase family oxygenase [Betaproteobacteria bacterium]|jgi:isopenicillin N synthase-like dioxygenase|nr:isopenicillin N synthase family oxygenase [Pseudomonadota bacterium]NBO94836.1 isopenicillin N synthase family oxygenase [Betaproteobacteria bacterium]NBP35321.1 isopenicillin N synthase family oxygenase [Betaproteobacteria bacterium]NBP38430.1 isopenicillin N synthase family oxygenase [Betaproteobacteria bacterium]NBQ78286.1 isopenicillin N synthase family oxygenase [Betaproteobacteria bacterium]
MIGKIPSISLLELDEPRSIERLSGAFEQLGFVIMTDHNISQALIDPFLGMFKQFFGWPEQDKLRFRLAQAGGARGYTPFGVETAKGSDHVDLKEFWHIGRELGAEHPYRVYMPPNLWIDAIEGFRSLCLEVFEAFDRVGRQILRAIARVLQLDHDFFEDKVDAGNSILRVIHYPPVPASPTQSLRAGAHEDINVITLLLGAEEPGLQIRSRAGDWLPVNPEAGSMVVNVGDMLQRLSNGVLRSTSHRVVNPASDRASSSRYAMPFFLHFNPDFLIEALPSCCGVGRPLPSPPMLADDYLQERLREIRLK